MANNLATLMKDIVNNNLPKLSYWIGEEIAVMKVYQNKIKELGYEVVILDTVEEALYTNSIRGFTTKPKCFIVNNDTDFIKTEKLQDKLLKSFSKSKNICVLKFSNIDKRSKFYKANEQKLISFDKLSEDVLYNYIHRDYKDMSDDNVYELISVCNNDYNRILLELDKIKAYSTNTKKNIDETVTQLLKDGTIYKPIGDVAFKLTDAVVYGELKPISELIYKNIVVQTSEMLLLSVLYTQFRNMLLVQGLGSDRAGAAAKTGLTGWQVKQVTDKIGGYSIAELIRALKVIRETELGIKTGQIDVDIAVEYAIIKIMS